jgi:hypothetical protein
MSDYTPDKWVVVKITAPDNPPVHKVFACWYGGYLGSDSWKLNSGITRAYEDGQRVMFDGSSGSTYACHKASYGTNLYGQGVLNNLIDKIERAGGTCSILPEETNWLEINYE